MKIVKQNDLRDCGVASLLSIIRHYGGNVPIERLRIDTHTDKDGTTAFNLIETAKKYGFDACGKKIDNLSSNLVYPIIAHLNTNGLLHFVVVYEVKKNKVVVMDPAIGKVIYYMDDFLNKWTGVILEFYPKDKILYLKKDNKLLDLIMVFVKDNKKLLFMLFMINILFVLFSIINSFFFKVGINNLENNLKLIVILFFIILVFKCILQFLRAYYENYINMHLETSLLKEFINHLFHLPSKVIFSRTVGEIVTRVSEVGNVKSLFTDLFIAFFLDFILTLVTIPILYSINNKLFLILCLSLLVYLVIGLFYSKYLYKKVMQNIDYKDKYNSYLIDSISCFQSINNLNVTNKILKENEYRISEFINDEFSMNDFCIKIESLKNFVSELCYLFINIFGLFLIKNGSLDFVNLVLFNTLISFFLDPIKNFIDVLPKFNFLKASFDKINDFIDVPVEEDSSSNINLSNYNLFIDNISFTYNDFINILSNFSLKVSYGEKILLKGRSGCGKSSLCKIIAGLESIKKGDLFIGDINYKDLKRIDLVNNILYVGQYENLMSDSIKNNLNFNREVDSELFYKIMKICHVDEIVKNKPLRYETFINMDSNNLSGGERQRIILARSLLNSFNILILDESLSEVDYKLERKIICNIKREYKDKTIIYVTHKKQDDLFDKVINMERCCE